MLKSSNNFKVYLSISVLLLSLSCLYYNILFQKKMPVIDDKSFQEIKGWSSSPVYVDSIVQEILLPDRVVYKQYNKKGKIPVTLFIAYYASLEKADKSHSPEVCFTGQGWIIQKNHVIKIPANNTEEKSFISVNEMIQTQGSEKMVAFYWFQNIHGSYSNRGIQKFILFINRLLGKSDSNAFMRLTAMVPHNMDTKETSSQLKIFMQELQPVISEYFH